jgi:hypothetical protein
MKEDIAMQQDQGALRAPGSNSRFDLIPRKPLKRHAPPKGFTADEIYTQKAANYAAMLELGRSLNRISKRLVQKAAFLAMQCHYNHFRGGKCPLHYSVHLLEVGRRVSVHFEYFSALVPILNDGQGVPIHPRAFAIAAAFLHDSIEDCYISLRSDHVELTKQQAQRLCREYLARELTARVGTTAAANLLEVIESLTIENEDEFPTTVDLARIKSSPYAYLVKLADIDHNLTTFADYSPAYACLMAACQYGPFVNGTPFEGTCTESLLSNVAVFDAQERASFVHERSVRTVELMLPRILHWEGLEGIQRVRAYYSELAKRIGAGEFDHAMSRIGLRRDHALKQIKAIQAAIE